MEFVKGFIFAILVAYIASTWTGNFKIWEYEFDSNVQPLWSKLLLTVVLVGISLYLMFSGNEVK